MGSRGHGTSITVLQNHETPRGRGFHGHTKRPNSRSAEHVPGATKPNNGGTSMRGGENPVTRFCNTVILVA